MIGIWLFAGALASAGERLACPDGAELQELAADGIVDRWCARPDGTAHGPSQRLDSSGRIVERGYWENGVASGHWRYYDTKGRVTRVGQMTGGLPEGAWTHYDPTGKPQATVTHGVAVLEEAPVRLEGDARFRWSQRFSAPPQAWWSLGNKVLVAVDGLVVVDVESGAVLGRVPLPEALRPDALVAGDSLFAVTVSGELVEVTVSPDDAIRWRRVRTLSGVTHVAGVDSQGRVVVRDGTGRLSGLNSLTAATEWTSRLAVDEVPPVQAGAVFVGVRAGREVRAVVEGTGEFVWQARMPNTVRSLGNFDGQVVVMTDHSEVVMLDGQSGTPLWTASLPVPPQSDIRLVPAGRGLWVAGPHAAFRLDPRTGESMDKRVALPPDGEAPADLSMERELSCTSGRTGGLRCMPGDWTLDIPPPVLPPLMGDGWVLVADRDGWVRAVDASVAAATVGQETAGATVLFDGEHSGIVVGGISSFEVDVPWVVVERTSAALEDACTVTTAIVGLPDGTPFVPIPEEGATEPPEQPWLWLDDTLLDDDHGAGSFAIEEHWSVENERSLWRMSWWHHHRPTVAALMATLGTPEDAARVDALLRCESGAARFRGIVRLDDGYRTLELVGNLTIAPHLHEIDGHLGCLLDVSVGGEDQGAWSSPVLPAWSEVVIEVVDSDSIPVIPEDGAFPTTVEGAVLVDAYEPWATARTSARAQGVVQLRIDDADARGPVLRAFAGDRRLVEVPVPDLRWGRVVTSEEGEVVPSPAIESYVDLGHPLPLLEDGGLQWQRVWTRSDCVAPAPPSLPPAERDPEPVVKVVEEDAPPLKPPAPLKPAKRRKGAKAEP